MRWKDPSQYSSAMRRIARFLLPDALRGWLRVNYVFFLQMGHWRSLRTRRVEWCDGEPVPWFSYAAVEYLRQLDFRGKFLFEYGAGSSSVFFAGRGATVVTVEADPTWHAWVRQRLPSSASAICEPDGKAFVETILRSDRAYDVIVIDANSRYECAMLAIRKLAPGGMIILDNADLNPEAAAVLRRADLLQVDFFDFAAGVSTRQATSIFYARDFRFTALAPAQPSMPVGGIELGEFRRNWRAQRGHPVVMLPP